MLCVECGEEEQFKDGVCKTCYSKNTHFTKGPEIIDIITCTTCSAYKYKNTWFTESFEEILKRHIKDIFSISRELTKTLILTECGEKKKKIDCKVTFSGYIEDQQITEQHQLIVRLKNTICDVCSKQFGGYFEAILQIRAEKRTPTTEEIQQITELVETLVEQFREKGNRGLFVTEITEEQGGLDFYLSEKGSAYTIAKKIQEKNGGEIKQSSTNAGMKDSKQLFRMTYLVRLPSYKMGDFIFYHKSYYHIVSISKNKVHMINLKNWSDQVIDGKELQKISTLGNKEKIKEMILVSQSTDEVQVMNQKTYKISDIKKPKTVTFTTKTIPVVVLEEQFFLLPE